MELKKILFLIVMLSSLASAQITSAQLSKPAYTAGDEILLTVTAYNPGAGSRTYNILCSFVPVNQTYGMYPLAEELQLNAGQSKTVNFSMYVSSTAPGGEWLAKLVMIEGDMIEGTKVDARNVSFQVGGTLMPIDLQVFACRDSGCSVQGGIFYMNETVYLRYNSSVGGVAVSGKILLPDDSEQSLTLPLDYRPVQTGTHTLTVTASKSGYQTAQSELKFGVLAGHVAVPTINISTAPENETPEEGVINITEEPEGPPAEGIAPMDLTLILGALAAVIVIIIVVKLK